MARYLQWWITGMALCFFVLLLLARGEANGEKESWQAILPKQVYEELTKREVDLVQEILKDTPKKQTLNRAKFGAILVASMTMSVKDGSFAEELRGTRETAVMLGEMLKNKDRLAAAQTLAAQLPAAKPVLNSKMDTINWRSLIEAPILMRHFLPKNEGGDGIHTDLQSSDRVKGAKNGILEKIRYLSANELTAAAIENEAKELELLGYRTAVIGSLTYYLVPTKMKANKTPQEWRDLAIQMRDHSVALAIGARKRDAAAVLKASTSLRSACSKCHNVF
jgi:hypothetical protein